MTYIKFCSFLFISILLSCQQFPDNPELEKEAINAAKEFKAKEEKQTLDTIGIIGKRICRNPIGPGDEGYFQIQFKADYSLDVEGSAGKWQAQKGKWESLADSLKIRIQFSPKEQTATAQQKNIAFILLKKDLRLSQADCLDLHVSLTALYD
jgi:hypothetical protein